MGSIYGILGPDLGLYDDTDLNNPAAYAASKGAFTINTLVGNSARSLREVNAVSAAASNEVNLKHSCLNTSPVRLSNNGT